MLENASRTTQLGRDAADIAYSLNQDSGISFPPH